MYLPVHAVVADPVGTRLGLVLDRLNVPRAERRLAKRNAFVYRLLLTPLSDGHAEATTPPSFEVVGCNLSAHGMGFEHSEPLPYRRVRLEAADPRLEELGLGSLEMVVQLRWCRFVGPGCYESGGRVTRTAAPLL